MNVNFEKIDNVNATLAVSFVEDDYKAEVKKQLRDIERRRPLKGYRPGFAPIARLQAMYGHEVLVDIVDRKLSRAVGEYIYENKVPILGEPMLDPETRVDLKTQKEFTFKFNIGLEPEFDVTVDSTLTIPYYTIEVTDEMVEKQNETYRHRYGKQVPGEMSAEDSMLRGTLIELDENGDEKADGIKVEKTVISPQYLKDKTEKNKFVGVKVGDTIVYNPYTAVDGSVTELAALLNVERDEAEVKSDFKYVVDEILVNEDAAMDQELFDAVLGTGEASNEDEYREKLKTMIAGQLTNDSNYRFTIDARETITAAVGELELPAEFLKRFLLSRQDEEKVNEEEFEKNFPAMLKQVQWQIIEQKIAAQLDVKVEEEDMRRLAQLYAAQQYAQYGIPNIPQNMIDDFAERLLQTERFRNDMHSRALEDKLFAAIKANATIDEKTVSVEEFNKLFEQTEA